MRCDFRSTGEMNGRGLPKLRCSRAGCANVCYSRHAPRAIRFRCKHPALFELGEVVAGAIKAVTLGRLREKPGCGCKRRREALNRRVAIAVPNWIYRRWMSVRRWLASVS
jgi:hypothetical protein